MAGDPENYEYRQAIRSGWYEWLAEERQRGEQYLITLTWSQEKLQRPPTANWLRKRAAREVRAQGLGGVLVAETARGDGRLHVHGIVQARTGTSGSVDALIEKWSHEVGFAHMKALTDLMGAVMYVTKAVTSETEWEMIRDATL